MSIEVGAGGQNAKPVKKIYKGDKQVYTDTSNNFIPLILNQNININGSIGIVVDSTGKHGMLIGSFFTTVMGTILIGHFKTNKHIVLDRDSYVANKRGTNSFTDLNISIDNSGNLTFQQTDTPVNQGLYAFWGVQYLSSSNEGSIPVTIS